MLLFIFFSLEFSYYYHVINSVEIYAIVMVMLIIMKIIIVEIKIIIIIKIKIVIKIIIMITKKIYNKTRLQTR